MDEAVAIFGSAAVSGGYDDTIKIYDLSSSSEIGSLHQSSAITSLSFFTSPSLPSFPRNLLATDADGCLSIYDVDPFVHLKTLKVHKNGVNSLSVHPYGGLALTVGHDECLDMVNLVRGRRNFYCKLSKESSIVQFNETGEKFFMIADEKISVHESEDARLIFELENGKRILCAARGTQAAGQQQEAADFNVLQLEIVKDPQAVELQQLEQGVGQNLMGLEVGQEG
ncbi:Transducin/WD40 repeat-like superfamily protein [Forsythia ovata]|uniref:Transducin/WD40 repeat-like superfamily protein n=1 Tax=Forsythia ovata TaxID=205694 RepID=A0ABD1TAU7_9LAMI